MTPKERIIRAFEHEEPDRVPLDYLWPSQRPEVWEKLKRYFNADDEGVRQKLGVDVRSVGVTMLKPVFPLGPPGTVLEDEFGIRYKVDSTGYYTSFVYHPLEHLESIDEYQFPDLNAPERFKEAEETIKKYGETYAIQAGLVPGEAGFDLGWYLRGYRKWMRDLYTNPKFVNDLCDRLVAMAIEQGERFIEMGVDIALIYGDYGTQTGLVIPPEIWRKYFRDRLKRLVNTLKSRGDIYVLFHCDGKMEQIIPDLLEMGVDALHPVQPDCMDPAQIKATYGDKLTLYGTVSVQETISRGNVQDVRREVVERIETCGKNGGLVLAPAHVPPPETKVENIVALYETAQKWRKK